MVKIFDKGDTPLVFPQFENEDKMTESEICLKCTGCCRYITVEIDKPRSKEKIQLAAAKPAAPPSAASSPSGATPAPATKKKDDDEW